jgi:hypothetical protein
MAVPGWSQKLVQDREQKGKTVVADPFTFEASEANAETMIASFESIFYTTTLCQQVFFLPLLFISSPP